MGDLRRGSSRTPCEITASESQAAEERDQPREVEKKVVGAKLLAASLHHSFDIRVTGHTMLEHELVMLIDPEVDYTEI